MTPDAHGVAGCIDAICDLISAHPMWIGDDGEPLGYLPEREARIGDFMREVARIVADRERVLRDRIAAVEGERDDLAISDAAEAERRAEHWEGLWALAIERAEAAEKELRQRELHHFETEQENADLRTRTEAAEAADLLADRERRAEARGAERALREAAEEIETTDGGISRGSVIRVGALADAARHLRDRADRIAGEGQ